MRYMPSAACCGPARTHAAQPSAPPPAAQVAEDNADARRLYARCGFTMERRTAHDALQLLRRPVLRAFLGSPTWLRLRRPLAAAPDAAAPGDPTPGPAGPETSGAARDGASTPEAPDLIAALNRSRRSSSAASGPGGHGGAAGASKTFDLTAQQPEHGEGAAKPGGRNADRLVPAKAACSLKAGTGASADRQALECHTPAGDQTCASGTMRREGPGAPLCSRDRWPARQRRAAALSGARACVCHALCTRMLLLFR